MTGATKRKRVPESARGSGPVISEQKLSQVPFSVHEYEQRSHELSVKLSLLRTAKRNVGQHALSSL